MRQAADAFLRYGFRALPVTDRDDVFLGVVPYPDVMNLSHLTALVEAQAYFNSGEELPCDALRSTVPNRGECVLCSARAIRRKSGAQD